MEKATHGCVLQSFFSWHVEDVDLLSINYLHYGASKVAFPFPPPPLIVHELVWRASLAG